MKLFLGLLSAVFVVPLTGCASGPWDAPPYAEISEVEDIEVSWFGCRRDENTGLLQNPNCEPSPPVIIPMTVQVVDGRIEDGDPLNNVRINITSGTSSVFILPQEVIEAIEVPSSSGWNNATDDGEVFAQFSGTFEEGYSPTYMQATTDNLGLVEFWIWVEAMPLDATGETKDSSILLDIGVFQSVLTLTAAS